MWSLIIAVQLKYCENDAVVLREKLENEREDHAGVLRDLQAKYTVLERESNEKLTTQRHDTKIAMTKALRELSKTQKVPIVQTLDVSILILYLIEM